MQNTFYQTIMEQHAGFPSFQDEILKILKQNDVTEEAEPELDDHEKQKIEDEIRGEIYSQLYLTAARNVGPRILEEVLDEYEESVPHWSEITEELWNQSFEDHMYEILRDRWFYDPEDYWRNEAKNMQPRIEPNETEDQWLHGTEVWIEDVIRDDLESVMEREIIPEMKERSSEI